VSSSQTSSSTSSASPIYTRAEFCRPNVVERQWVQLELDSAMDHALDADVLNTIARVTGGSFRLIQRLFAQIERVLTINELATVTSTSSMPHARAWSSAPSNLRPTPPITLPKPSRLYRSKLHAGSESGNSGSGSSPRRRRSSASTVASRSASVVRN
jgi:hypothetical protein